MTHSIFYVPMKLFAPMPSTHSPRAWVMRQGFPADQMLEGQPDGAAQKNQDRVEDGCRYRTVPLTLWTVQSRPESVLHFSEWRP